VASVTRASLARAGADGVDLVVAAVTGPGSSVLDGHSNRRRDWPTRPESSRAPPRRPPDQPPAPAPAARPRATRMTTSRATAHNSECPSIIRAAKPFPARILHRQRMGALTGHASSPSHSVRCRNRLKRLARIRGLPPGNRRNRRNRAHRAELVGVALGLALARPCSGWQGGEPPRWRSRSRPHTARRRGVDREWLLRDPPGAAQPSLDLSRGRCVHVCRGQQSCRRSLVY
jgi:hypothetical protein